MLRHKSISYCFKGVKLSVGQKAILLGLGLQFKTVDTLSQELKSLSDTEDVKKQENQNEKLPVTQLLALFNRAIRKIMNHLNGICEKAIQETNATSIGSKRVEIRAEPTPKSLQEDLDEAAEEFEKQSRKDKKKLQEMDLDQYAIRGSQEDWSTALATAKGGILSVKG